jgi:hypothetical protein
MILPAAAEPELAASVLNSAWLEPILARPELNLAGLELILAPEQPNFVSAKPCFARPEVSVALAGLTAGFLSETVARLKANFARCCLNLPQLLLISTS